MNHPPTPGFSDDGSGGGAHPLQSLMDRMTAGGGGGAGGLDPSDLSNVLRGRYALLLRTISHDNGSF